MRCFEILEKRPVILLSKLAHLNAKNLIHFKLNVEIPIQ